MNFSTIKKVLIAFGFFFSVLAQASTDSDVKCVFDYENVHGNKQGRAAMFNAFNASMKMKDIDNFTGVDKASDLNQLKQGILKIKNYAQNSLNQFSAKCYTKISKEQFIKGFSILELNDKNGEEMGFLKELELEKQLLKEKKPKTAVNGFESPVQVWEAILQNLDSAMPVIEELAVKVDANNEKRMVQIQESSQELAELEKRIEAEEEAIAREEAIAQKELELRERQEEIERRRTDLQHEKDRVSQSYGDNSSLNSVTQADVCKTAIQYLSSMNGDRNEAIDKGGMVRINQTRASDGKRFYYDCKINGNSISWRMNQADGSMGRWRGDGTFDPKVTFSVSNGHIFIYEN